MRLFNEATKLVRQIRRPAPHYVGRLEAGLLELKVITDNPLLSLTLSKRGIAGYNVAHDQIILGAFYVTDYETCPDVQVAILFHELIHWSGVSYRLNRPVLNDIALWTDINARLLEEDVANLGAMILIDALGVGEMPEEFQVDPTKTTPEVVRDATEAADYVAKFLSENGLVPNKEEL